jgi:hypothetical protein
MPIHVNNIDKKNIQKNLIFVNFMIIFGWFISISQTDGRTGRACLKDVHVLSFTCIIFLAYVLFKKISITPCINLDFFLIFKTQIHTQFFLKNGFLIRNLQEICKILKTKHKTQILKKLKTQIQT